jgi:hypothetical protein
MRILTWSLGIFLVTLIATQVSARENGANSIKSYTCRLITGYGTAIGTGPTRLEAEARARELCGSKLIDDYFARRGKIDPDADLELACINIPCQ